METIPIPVYLLKFLITAFLDDYTSCGNSREDGYEHLYFLGEKDMTKEEISKLIALDLHSDKF